MLRAQLSEGLKSAMKARQERPISTIRLILAALKDRDIAARGKGNHDGISDDEIRQMLQNMIHQRNESIALYEQGGRLELAQQEREEIHIIQSFLPQQLGEAEIERAARSVIAEVGATCIKDMGKTMAALKQRYAGQMDFSKAGAVVKNLLNA
ncbi:MAG TPA: GatB/YqeY domain-containing protein [Alphaproteobacteria bacterium]|nr:GatB/YqeY domain-containing protein [Alphaproteobacteria bacterium]